ncbi:MAG: carboxypeptidase-like regulatory domain-containing protein, partial [Flectobacillus sp.]|uniref:carboxypeptidase-like regulatory domain-containing protein n=1 Tax=Flectobacillus sp. TaxID=50419 RepID=UPI003B9BF9D6
MHKFYLWAFFLFITLQSLSQTLSGYVREAKSQESLSDVHIRVKNARIGTTSNVYGFYSIKLDASREYELEFSKVGYQSFSKKILLTANQTLIVELTPSNTLLEEVKVHNTANEDPSTLSLQMSDVKQLPSFLGEKDVLKTFQL